MDYSRLAGKQERLNRLMNLKFASYFDDMPLTSTQALALDFVMRKAKFGYVYQKDIEVFLSIRGSSVASLINNLERDGFIRRETVSFDGRYKHLAPTQKALDIREDIDRRIDEYINSLFIDIADEDLRVFEQVIDKMTANAK